MRINKKDLESIKRRIDFDKLKDKSILLTGATGFLGNWFSEFFDTYNIKYLKYDPAEDPNNDVNKVIDLPRFDTRS